MSSKGVSDVASSFSLRKLLVVMGIFALPMPWYRISPAIFAAGLVSAIAMSGAVLLTPRGRNLELAVKFVFGLIAVLTGGLAGRFVHQILDPPGSQNLALGIIPGGVIGLFLVWRPLAFLAARVRRSPAGGIGESQFAGAEPFGTNIAVDQPKNGVMRRIRVVVAVLSLALVPVVGAYYLLRMRREHRARAAIAQLRMLGADSNFLRSPPMVCDYDIMDYATYLRFRDLGRVTDEGLECLECLNFQWVDFSGAQIGDTTLEHLKGMTRLRDLDLTDTQVTDAGLKHLKGLTSLEELSLNGTQVTDVGLKHLKGLTRLEGLHLDNTQVSDAALEHLKGLINLEGLSLKGSQVTDGGLNRLKTLTNLWSLDLESTQITGDGLEHLKGLNSLQDLSLNNTRVTDVGLKHLRGLPKLGQLHLNDTQVTDMGLAQLTECPRIFELYLNNTQV